LGVSRTPAFTAHQNLNAWSKRDALSTALDAPLNADTSSRAKRAGRAESREARQASRARLALKKASREAR
jgi:hypothetical protein